MHMRHVACPSSGSKTDPSSQNSQRRWAGTVKVDKVDGGWQAQPQQINSKHLPHPPQVRPSVLKKPSKNSVPADRRLVFLMRPRWVALPALPVLLIEADAMRCQLANDRDLFETQIRASAVRASFSETAEEIAIPQADCSTHMLVQMFPARAMEHSCARRWVGNLLLPTVSLRRLHCLAQHLEGVSPRLLHSCRCDFEQSDQSKQRGHMAARQAGITEVMCAILAHFPCWPLLRACVCHRAASFRQ